MSENSKVHRLPGSRAARADDDLPITTVKVSRCQHLKISVDEDLAEVTCRDCGERLNPIAVLAGMAKRDRSIHTKRVELRDEVKRLGDRTKYKCGRCGAMNNISETLKFRVK